MTLARAAEWCGGELRGPAGAESAVMTGATMDTRELRPGDLFVALPGERADGAEFIPEAARLGACAALTSAPDIRDEAPPRIVVSDPVAALAELARKWREKNTGVKVVAVTGTNGKTTTREMTAAILRARFGDAAVLTPTRNFNNHLGVPLTILRLRDSHCAAVLELGMNRAGEIAALARVAKPDIGIITNAGRGHLEGLGTVENVARAKGELIENLPPDGAAVLNADDPHFPLWREMAGDRRIYSFGFENPRDSRCRKVVITIPGGKKNHGEFPPDTPRHIAANTMAACAGLGELNVSDELGEVRAGGLSRDSGAHGIQARAGRRDFDRRLLQRESGFGFWRRWMFWSPRPVRSLRRWATCWSWAASPRRCIGRLGRGLERAGGFACWRLVRRRGRWRQRRGSADANMRGIFRTSPN